MVDDGTPLRRSRIAGLVSAVAIALVSGSLPPTAVAAPVAAATPPVQVVLVRGDLPFLGGRADTVDVLTGTAAEPVIARDGRGVTVVAGDLSLRVLPPAGSRFGPNQSWRDVPVTTAAGAEAGRSPLVAVTSWPEDLCRVPTTAPQVALRDVILDRSGAVLRLDLTVAVACGRGARWTITARLGVDRPFTAISTTAGEVPITGSSGSVPYVITNLGRTAELNAEVAVTGFRRGWVISPDLSACPAVLLPGRQCTARIRWSRAAGAGPLSAILSLPTGDGLAAPARSVLTTAVPPVRAPVVSPVVGTDGAGVRWDPVDDVVPVPAAYHVFRRATPSSPWQSLGVVTDSWFADTSLSPGQSAQYAVASGAPFALGTPVLRSEPVSAQRRSTLAAPDAVDGSSRVELPDGRVLRRDITAGDLRQDPAGATLVGHVAVAGASPTGPGVTRLTPTGTVVRLPGCPTLVSGTLTARRWAVTASAVPVEVDAVVDAVCGSRGRVVAQLRWGTSRPAFRGPQITVVPPPATTWLGTASQATVRVVNPESTSLVVPAAVAVLSPPGAVTSSGSCGGTLAPGDVCVIDVRFAPRTAGRLDARLAWTGASLSGPRVVPLTTTAVRDTYAPVTHVASWPATVRAGDRLSVRLTATDRGTGIRWVERRTRVASGITGRVSAWVVPRGWGRVAPSATPPGLTVSAYSTVCVSSRAADRSGNVSAWSAPRCATALTSSASWRRVGRWTGVPVGPDRQPALRSSGPAAALVGPIVRNATQVVIRLSACSRCGVVEVSVAGRVAGRVDTAASGTRDGVVRAIRVPRGLSGRVVLRVVGPRPVTIESIGVR